VVYLQAESGGYLAEVMLDVTISFRSLASKIVSLLQAVAAGERPMLAEW